MGLVRAACTTDLRCMPAADVAGQICGARGPRYPPEKCEYGGFRTVTFGTESEQFFATSIPSYVKKMSRSSMQETVLESEVIQKIYMLIGTGFVDRGS